jgi:hypothetical protein
MAYGAPQIIGRLNELVPAAGAIERLTYRVGSLPEARQRLNTGLPPLRTPAEIARALHSESTEPATTIAEALERCRRAVSAVRTQYLAEGGQACPCGTLIADGALCLLCKNRALEQTRLACAKLLHVRPTTTVAQACAQIPSLTRADYEKVRFDRLRSYYDEIVRARDLLGKERPIDERRVLCAAAAFIALETRLQDISEAVRRNTLGDLYEFVISVERYVPEEALRRTDVIKARIKDRQPDGATLSAEGRKASGAHRSL